MTSLKGANAAPTSCYDSLHHGNVGWPTGGDSQGHGASIVLRTREGRAHGEGKQVTAIPRDREVCEMQSADAVLSILHERGTRGLPLNRLYRHLFNPQLYLLAYGKIYRNKGAMTPGSTPETVDGMTLEKISSIIAALRAEQYRWTPVRRIYIEKKHSKKLRPLGLPSWSDKLLQEAMRLLLTAYFEPQFSTHSHGFRPERGCHTALNEIYHEWVGTTWFVESDIAQCFDSLDHTTLVHILGEKIHDGRFLRLIETLLQAGYLEQWRYHATYSGSPQGSLLSPILANCYLDKADKFFARLWPFQAA
jgi:retron-type reverse transcriptase